MAPLFRLRAFLRNLLFRSRVDRELGDELQSFAGLVEDEARAAGAAPAPAASAGRRALGNVAATTDAVRQTRAAAGVERLRQDVGYAIRTLRRSPAFTALTVLILTLGIGSVATMFAVVDAALFKPLPYRNPDQIVNVGQVVGSGAEEAIAIGVTWTEFDWWRSRHDVFSDAAPFQAGRAAVVDGAPVSGTPLVSRVSPALLQMFGVRPILGRWFLTSDAEPPIALISESLWRHGFGANPAVLGRTITIDHVPCTVVGVMPATFGAAVGGNGRVVAWLPFDESLERRIPGSHAATVFRLRDGLDLARGQAAAQLAARGMPGASSTVQVKLLPLDTREWIKTTNHWLLQVMLGVVALVLLIACANVANLLLARAVTRRRELAVRAALGASRARLVRQLLTEGVVLALLGGAGGVGLAALATKILPDELPAQLWLFDFNPMQLDARVLGVSAVAVAITTLLCSVLPAVRASRTDLLEALEGGGRAVGSRSGQRLRHGLQVVEIALTLILVCGTTLLASSFVHMVWTPDGYRLDGLAMANVSLPAARYQNPAAQVEFFDRLITDVRHVPGVEAAAYGYPPSGNGGGNFTVKGREQDSGARIGASTFWVEPEYFGVVGIPIKTGRDFDKTDISTSPGVALVDEDTARRFWPGESPIGKEFRYSLYVPWITVVGVTGRVKTTAFASPDFVAEVFMPQAQSSSQSFRTITFRAASDPLAPMAGIRSALQALDPRLDLRAPRVVADLYDDVFVQPRFYVVLMSVFAGLSALTAAVGLFGLLNYSVSQRQREIGVRIALGAALGDIRRLVVRDAVMTVVVGIAIGLGGALLLARLLQTVIFGISVHDVASYAAAVLLLAGIAAVSTLVPARRAARVDPVRALRVE